MDAACAISFLSTHELLTFFFAGFFLGGSAWHISKIVVPWSSPLVLADLLLVGGSAALAAAVDRVMMVMCDEPQRAATWLSFGFGRVKRARSDFSSVCFN